MGVSEVDGQWQRRSRVLVIGTGGTIAGSTAHAQGHHYVAGELSVASLLDAVPALSDIAALTGEELFRVDSVEMDLDRQLTLARRIAQAMDDPTVDGVVVTHGTDTMEETAYLVHLTVETRKPVVLVGAMRPANATSADGPANLLGAVRVAATQAAAAYGVLIVVGDEIHGARDIRKEHTTRVNAFGSAHGPLGELGIGGVHFRSRPTRGAAAFDVRELPELPLVEVVMAHPAQPRSILDAVIASGARGIVHVGPGAGNVASGMAELLDEARKAGIVVVRCSRVGSGSVRRNDAMPDDAHDWVAGDDLPPFKARVLLALALSRTQDPAQIQRLFDTY